MLPITDLNNNTELLTNIKGLRRKRRVNGEKVLEFFVIPDDSNEHSYGMVDTESIVEFDGEEYVIKQANEKSVGRKTIKQVSAVHRFFDDMINAFQYKQRSGSMTFNVACTFVFENTGYTFNIIDPFLAEPFENFGRDNSLSLFKTILERYGAEFYVVGNQVYIKRKIGVNGDFQYRYAHNVKTIDKEISTRNLATIIKGFGGTPDNNGVYPIQEEYRSPNIAIFGEKHAPAIYDERITTVDGMQARLQRELIDEPQLSITVDSVDLRASGYNYHTASEGDYGFIIYEPMNVDVEARIVEIDEEYDANLKPLKTAVTLSNLRRSMTDVMTRMQQTTKTVNRILEGNQQIPYNVLDDAVKIATEALQSAQTELEFNNGIISRDKVNPNELTLLNSKGFGLSLDGGQTFDQAITAHGINATVITVGFMLFNMLRGGTLQLGGYENTNGVMQVLNSNGDVIADLDGDRGGFSSLNIGELTVQKIINPEIIIPRTTNQTFYVSSTGNDDNSGTSGSPLFSIREAVSRISYVLDASVNIILNSDRTEDVDIKGINGGGIVTLNLNGKKLNGRVRVISNSVRVVIRNGEISYRGTGDECLFFETTPFADVNTLTINGNGQESGIRAFRGSHVYITETSIHNVQNAIFASSVSHLYISNCTGHATVYGIYGVTGAILTGSGTAPTGGTADIYTTSTALVVGSWSTGGTPAPPPAPPVTEITEVFTPTSTGNWRQNFGGQWNSNNSYPYQGKWNEWGMYYGLWFFGEAIRTKVNGKNVKRIRIRPHRRSEGGYSSGVSVVFRTHNHATRPTGEPTVSSHTHTASFSWGEQKWIDLPSNFRDAFSGGTARGIAIYTTTTSNSAYAIFNTSLDVEITYE